MRKLCAVFLAALVAFYGAVSIRLFVQERWAEELPPAGVAPGAIHHPEALLALVQYRFANNRYRDEEKELVTRALVEAPSFYQPPYLLAVFYASRLERPDRVRAAFQTAVARYPKNGRLRLAYGTWLLESRGTLEGWRSDSDPTGFRDPLPDAELHLRAALEVEPELSWNVMTALSKNRIPTSRWAALVPDHPLARTSLLDALFQAGELESVWTSLKEGELPSDDPDILRRVVHWGLEGGRPEIALEAAIRWKSRVERTRGDGPDVLQPALWVSRAHLAVGDPDAAYDSLVETLERLESKFGARSRVSLEFLCAMGQEYLNRGHLATAEALFGQAESRSPSYVPAILGLARTLARSGDAEAALDYYEEVMRLEPGNEAAGRELKSLLARANR